MRDVLAAGIRFPLCGVDERVVFPLLLLQVRTSETFLSPPPAMFSPSPLYKHRSAFPTLLGSIEQSADQSAVPSVDQSADQSADGSAGHQPTTGQLIRQASGPVI